MWSPELAVQLRRGRHDVTAVAEQAGLRGLPDAEILRLASAEDRAVVTDNVRDYRPLARHVIEEGGSHAGLIFTSNRSFPRHTERVISQMFTALDQLLDRDCNLTNLEHWL